MKIVNPWEGLKKKEPLVLPEDKDAVAQYNEKYKDTPFEIKLDVMPVPFVGDVHKSEIVILMLNPKYNDDTKINENDKYKEKLISVFKHKCHNHPFFCLDPAIIVGKNYWEPKLKNLLTVYHNYETIAHKVSNIQYHPYSSKEFRPIELDSQRYNFHLVRKAMQRDAIIVVARGKKYWHKAVPELVNYQHYVSLNSLRNPTLSPKNSPKLFEILGKIKRLS